MELEGIDHVAMSVRDVERSAQWYIDILGFEHRHKGVWDGVPTFIGKGKTAIALFPAKSNTTSTSLAAVALGTPKRDEGGPAKAASSRGEIRMLHLAFRADRKNFLAAQEELKQRRIKFESSDHEISHSIYFRDPDGHELEITTYEL